MLGVFALTLSVQAQSSTFDPDNVRDGETIEYCLQHKKRRELLLIPGYAESLLIDEQIRAQEALNNTGEAKLATYYIPIVFHIVHNNGAENISDEQILDCFDILNRDFDLQNLDAANVAYAFNASNPTAIATPTDVDIEFRLATIAPDGTCFSGITRTVSTATSSGDGFDSYLAAKNGNDVYQGEWPGDEYLNVFICADPGGAGYTTTPGGWYGSTMPNGIYLQHSYIGSIGTGSTYTSRALTHECGHWLNLSHTWGPNNNEGNPTSCPDDDGVSDTPRCIGISNNCNLTFNSCSPQPGDDDWGADEIDNIENYMDYSYCTKMFTAGQSARMNTALQSNIANRNNLFTPGNLAATGATGNFYLCKAEFSANKTAVCSGGSIQFSDESFNEVNGVDMDIYRWYSFIFNRSKSTDYV